MQTLNNNKTKLKQPLLNMATDLSKVHNNFDSDLHRTIFDNLKMSPKFDNFASNIKNKVQNKLS